MHWFFFYRYGLPDPGLQRDCDIQVKLKMSSVRYVHTNRFQSEFVAFLQHFLQLQDVLGRMRAASAGMKVCMSVDRFLHSLLKHDILDSIRHSICSLLYKIIRT